MAVTAKNVDMSVNINGLVLKNPILTASGTYGYNNEFDAFIDVQSIGSVVTKAISLAPRPGNAHERIFETQCGLINSIGLENVGIQEFIKTKVPVLEENKIEYIVNLAGSTAQEYVQLAKICEENKIKAIELNLSCPNVKSGCLEFGTDENILSELVSQVRDVFKGTLIVKLTPNVTSIEKIAIAAQKSGADCISAINTVKALGFKLEFKNGKFKKKHKVQGGLSGKAIKPIALGVISRLSLAVDIPIIAMGGIYTLDDVLEFLSVGAVAVQIGTANFTHPNRAQRLVEELEIFMLNKNINSLNELKIMLMES